MFKLGDLAVDRIIAGVAQNNKGKLLYTLTNLQQASIEITADSTDVTDGTGAVIKTFYRAKQGKFTATNSTINLPIIGAMSGTDPRYASDSEALSIPMIITTAKTSVTLPNITGTGEENNIVVNAIEKNGTLGAQYTLASGTATAGTYSVAAGKMTINPADGDTKFIIKYDRSITKDAIAIVNKADAFPKTVKLTLKVLIVDPCEPDTVRACYIVIPSFQPSAEVTVDIKTDATIDYTGTLQASYCADEKILYEILACQDDEEDES